MFRRAAGAVLAAFVAAPSGLAAAEGPRLTDLAVVARGEALARIGDCETCHTTKGGRAYAGGVPIRTPFGVVYSTNLTPDAATGLGRWSPADFRTALRNGTAPGDRQLYPAFPYDHFAGLGDGDIADLYAYLRSRAPVRAEPPPNRLIFPLGFRPLMIGWKLLFFHPKPVTPDPAQSAEWNRGRYLAETLGHCGACHTPHGALGAEEKDKPYAGGWAEGWYAPPLNAASPAAAPWTSEALESYFRTGLSSSHAAAAGPMGPVARQLAAAPAADVHALAIYFASLMTRSPGLSPSLTIDRPDAAARAHPRGAALFAGACAACHGEGAPMMQQGRPNLTLGTPLHEQDPRDTLAIILEGLRPPVGRAGPAMPPFAASFSDAEVAEIAGYLRVRYTRERPWPGDLVRAAAKARQAQAS